MLTYWGAVGGYTCGYIYWLTVMAYVTKGNAPQKFMQTHSQIVCIIIIAKDA